LRNWDGQKVPKVTDSKPLLLKIPAAAAELQISESKFYGLLRDKKIRSVRLGPNATRIPYSEIEAYIKRLLEQQAPPSTAA
jgi:excisionase family DNA binding protein